MSAQCAGEDGQFTVCNITDPSSKTIDLFSKLTGSPLTGGIWNDDNSSGGLNSTTGVLNVQQIRRSGIYHYTYTVDGIGLCPDNAATVTVTVGGYAGVPSNAVVCTSTKMYNLFQAFNGLYLGAQSNGIWHDDTKNEDLPPGVSYINVEGLKEGDYPFTYTMPAIGTCPAVSSSVVISIFEAPEAGDATSLLLCSTDGLSGYTNVDLESLLSGQDPDGTWTDESGTGELTFTGDHFVDAQKIFNKFGLGTYRFKYKVLSTKNSICSDDEATVQIIIEKKLDFTGATIKVNSDICETEIATATYYVTIDRKTAVIPDGKYIVGFTVSGRNGGSEIIEASFTNGILIFPIKSQYFQQIGNYTVSIYNMYLSDSAKACQNIMNLSDVLSIVPIPDLIGAKIATVTTCQNTSPSVNIYDANRMGDGTYEILYNVSGVNNGSSLSAQITFTGGIATPFTIPSSLTSQSGGSVIVITNITHVDSGIRGCTNTANIRGDLLVNSLPNASNVKIQIPDAICLGSPVNASVSGLGTLTNVKLSYVLSGSNTATVQTIDLSPVNGNATFTIPANLLLNTGLTTATVTNLINNVTGCSADVTGASDPFSLNPIPVAPVAVNQSFCKYDLPTVANLVPNGAQFSWYISATATTPLASAYLLKSEDYYVKETALGCTSEATKISVTLNDIPAPELNQDGEKFCGLDSPTIADLSNNTNASSSIVWYDSNGILQASTNPLIDKKEYIGYDFSTATPSCRSFDSLKVIVSLTNCPEVPSTFFIPDGFSPNGDGVNDVFVIPDIDFLYPDYIIEIFNRYGNGMYRGGKDKPGWDGLNYETQGLNHGIAPNGVYFYVLHFNKDNKPPKQGRLYLNR
ncbi:gliding motility-associated C-terminal domain-containing protein [Flavobacterium sp. MR2016-29]|uniref:gliding motility-associated C-terminal domain-containing protein n=1 Tax=Flavobacterium sp. MR2016-29 TaxID=2783795 RepID=UPI001E4220F6|nr:gliding motility-associated C-terminal domain-containing protein [Flavobacterium sp. MR2016-29]